MTWEIINHTRQAVLDYECKACGSPVMCVAYETNSNLHLDKKKTSCTNFMCKKHNEDHNLLDLIIGGDL